ncbi:MAG: aldehyde dehydrogenase family protein, partial [Proteobacteria bacterium]
LPAAPAMLGNVVVWKPSESQALSAHYLMQMFLEAGLPPGVINLVHGEGASVAEACLDAPDFAGLHFTGSTEIFRSMQRRIGEKLASYKNFPRVVGETGGKDFVLAHASAEPESLAVALVRGAFEFQGQKCSAASRAYVPRSLWPKVRARVLDEIRSVRLGDVRDFRTFMGAVIHERSYDKLHGWKTRLEADAQCTVHGGDRWSKTEGWFAGPTVVEVADPHHDLLQTELFGPVLGVHVYDDARFAEVCALVDETSPYALTGALFGTDRAALTAASDRLRHAAGNLYLNDKPTGAVVAQQPFGGGRASGTNDKAGSVLNLLRWISPRVIKETFCPPTAVPYPSMAEE